MSDLHLEEPNASRSVFCTLWLLISCLVQKVLTPNNSLDHLQCRCISLDQKPFVYSVIWITATCVTDARKMPNGQAHAVIPTDWRWFRIIHLKQRNFDLIFPSVEILRHCCYQKQPD